jgi:hypothetical protein
MQSRFRRCHTHQELAILGVLQHSVQAVQHPGRQQASKLHSMAAAAAGARGRASLLHLQRRQQLRSTQRPNQELLAGLLEAPPHALP